MNENIYAIGGLTEDQDITSSCEKYDIKEDKWITISSLNKKANNACVCAYKNKFLFKFGGKTDDNILNQLIEKYVPEIDIWQVIEY